ncbi:MAG: sigma-70 family RNA polymerase sigma factor [Actinobacteria bacterium]|nr:MAG: sigma-70 family RNA polymerase sigma factor [Actinomycetota bacterium]
MLWRYGHDVSLAASLPVLVADGIDERGLAQAASTSPDAFAVLYRRHVGPIHAFAYRRSGSREVAEEVTSATFERAWRAMPSFEWRGGGFKAWLFAIAARELAGWYRRNARSGNDRAQRALRLLHTDVIDEEHERVSAEDEQALVREALSTLPQRYQEAISLRHFAGLDPDEAAAAMGCTKAVLAVTLHRATKALRRAIERRRSVDEGN